MTDGLNKHERNSWMKYSTWYSIRHIFIHLFWWGIGVKIDKDSGDTHLSHAMCGLCILCDNDLRSGSQEVT